MIKSISDCNTCLHKKVCKNFGATIVVSRKLNEEVQWSDESGLAETVELFGVDITVSCPSYHDEKHVPGIGIRGGVK